MPSTTFTIGKQKFETSTAYGDTGASRWVRRVRGGPVMTFATWPIDHRGRAIAPARLANKTHWPRHVRQAVLSELNTRFGLQ